MKTKIVIAGTYPDGVFEKFHENLSSENVEVIKVETQEEYACLKDADIIVLRVLKMDKEDIERIKGLKVIIRWGVGYDTVDIEKAGEKGIYVCNTPGANAFAVAELTVMMMLALGRKLAGHQKKIAEGLWSKHDFQNECITLHNKMVGIIGGGNIGRQVALRVQAFGAHVQYFDPYRMDDAAEKEMRMKYVPFEDLLRTSDFVTVHVPLTDDTYHLIGAKEICMMKQGAYIINAARGGIVDDQALEEAVLSGKLGGAGIDTLEIEPPAADSKLRNNTNILLTPHIGGDVLDVSEISVPMICCSIKKYLSGEEPNHIVNRSYLKNEIV